MRALVVLVAALLAASSFALITAQHRVRGLFVDLERAQQQARAMAAEGERLRIELGRATQPAAIEAAARGIGLRPVDAGRTVYLPADATSAAAPAPKEGR